MKQVIIGFFIFLTISVICFTTYKINMNSCKHQYEVTNNDTTSFIRQSDRTSFKYRIIITKCKKCGDIDYNKILIN